MQFEAEAAVLRGAIDFVARSAQRRSPIPILSALKLSASEDGVEIEGTTMDRTARAQVAAEIAVEGAICAPVEGLTRFCKVAPKGSTVSAKMQDGRLALAAGRASVKLPTFPTSDWPETGRSLPEMAEIDAEAFCAALNGANAAASTEEVRFYLNGTYLAANRAVATDGHRMVIFDLPNDYDAIIPYRDVPEICRLLEKGGRFGATANGWVAETDGRTLFGRCVEGSYPDIDRITPAADVVALVGRDDFLAGVNAASLGTTCGIKVSASAGDDALRMEARISGRNVPDGLGETAVTVPAEVKADIEGGFNAGYLRDAMNAMPDAEIAMRLAGADTPALFEPSEGSAFLGRRAVVMGMRLGNAREEAAA